MSYGLELSHQAKKTLKLLDKATIQRIEKRFIELSRAPYDSRRSEPLEMGEGERKTRVGSWRIIYAIRENDETIYVFSIEPRGKAYRRFWLVHYGPSPGATPDPIPNSLVKPWVAQASPPADDDPQRVQRLEAFATRGN